LYRINVNAITKNIWVKYLFFRSLFSRSKSKLTCKNCESCHSSFGCIALSTCWKKSVLKLQYVQKN